LYYDQECAVSVLIEKGFSVAFDLGDEAIAKNDEMIGFFFQLCRSGLPNYMSIGFYQSI